MHDSSTFHLAIFYAKQITSKSHVHAFNFEFAASNFGFSTYSCTNRHLSENEARNIKSSVRMVF